MLSIFPRFLHTRLSLLCQIRPSFVTSAKKIRDSDQLSPQQLDELLGKDIKESAQKMQTQAMKEEEQKSLLQKQKTYYYGLMPLKNQNYPECLDPDEAVIQETINQNLFKDLQLADNCNFADYVQALNKYRTEVDLYGDQQPKQIIENNSLQFKHLLDPQGQYLTRARKYQLINISIPGSIETEDPRNFMQLRPIQQFRHTPLVPISESYMKKHKEMLERYHRKQFVFEVSKQKIINWALVSTCVAVGCYFLYIILQKQEERTINYSKLKYQRLMGESADKPVFRI